MVSDAARVTRARSATTSTGASGRANPLRRSCSAGKSSTSAHHQLVALADVPAVEPTLHLATGEQGARPGPPSAARAERNPARDAGVAPRLHQLALLRRAQQPDRREHARARRHDHGVHPEQRRPPRTRAAVPRRRTRPARAHADRRPARPSPPAPRAPSPRRPPRSHRPRSRRRVRARPAPRRRRAARSPATWPGCDRARDRRR